MGPRSEGLIHESWYDPAATFDLRPIATREDNFVNTVLGPQPLPTEDVGNAVVEDDEIPVVVLDDSEIPSLDDLSDDSDDESFDCEDL